MIQYITSKTNDRIKDIVKLRDNKTQKQEQCYLVEGFHMLEMALNYNVVLEVYTTKELKIDDRITQFIITEEILDKISSSKNSQGVVCKCRMQSHSQTDLSKIIYLDDVNDPGNLGTILRTSLAFSFFNVWLSPNCVSPFNDKALAASQGAIFALNIERKSIIDLKKLKDNGYQIIATALENSVDIKKIEFKDKFVVVLGNEAHGVSKSIIDLADICTIIPIQNIESLNVGVAAGIIMYQMKK